MDSKFGQGVLCGAAAILAVSALRYAISSQNSQNSTAKEEVKVEEAFDRKGEVVAIIGDVGGTNVRLQLVKLCLKTRTSVTLK